jgi:hypothetical protein
MVRFADAYAELNECDHLALGEARRSLRAE